MKLKKLIRMPFPLYPTEPKSLPLQREVKLLPRHAGHKPFREIMMSVWLGTLIATLGSWPLALLEWSFVPTLIAFLAFWILTTVFFFLLFRAA